MAIWHPITGRSAIIDHDYQMEFALALVSGLSVGSLITTFYNARQARQQEARARRHGLYVEMLSLLVRMRRHTARLSFAPDEPPPDDLDAERLDLHDAKLMIDATPAVRTKAQVCYRLVQMFWNAYTMRAPIDVDEHGIFTYRFDKVRTSGDPNLVMRIALSGIHDDLSKAVDALSDQMRRELNG